MHNSAQKLFLTGIAIVATIALLSNVYAAPSANVLQHKGYIDPSGIYHVVGEIANTGDEPLGFMVEILYYDSDGVPIAHKKSYTSILTVMPGQIAPFDSKVAGRDIADSIASYEMQIVAQAVKPKPQSLHIGSNISYMDGLGLYHVLGEITNGNNSQSTYTYVVATFYDEEGQIITVGRTLVDPVNIPPEGTATFKITVHRDLADKIDSYALVAESSQFVS